MVLIRIAGPSSGLESSSSANSAWNIRRPLSIAYSPRWDGNSVHPTYGVQPKHPDRAKTAALYEANLTTSRKIGHVSWLGEPINERGKSGALGAFKYWDWL